MMLVSATEQENVTGRGFIKEDEPGLACIESEMPVNYPEENSKYSWTQRLVLGQMLKL